MVMLTLGAVEAVLESQPSLDSVDYRNAWATVEARLARSTDPDKLTLLQDLHTRMIELGEPRKPQPLSREEALAQAQAANEARVVGRCKAQILRKIAAAQYRRTPVTDRKPWMFEAALQLLEDGEASLTQSSEDFPERGFQPASGSRKIKRLVLGPPDPEFSRPCPWMSRKKQAGEDRI